MSEWKIEADEAAIRRLLDEPTATFPAIRAVPVIGGYDFFLGRFHPERRQGDYHYLPSIEVACPGNRSRRSVQNTVIHELRHWWQYADPERLRAISRSYDRKKRIFWSLVAGGFIVAALG